MQGSAVVFPLCGTQPQSEGRSLQELRVWVVQAATNVKMTFPQIKKTRFHWRIDGFISEARWKFLQRNCVEKHAFRCKEGLRVENIREVGIRVTLLHC
jgi:hypothetical protein